MFRRKSLVGAAACAALAMAGLVRADVASGSGASVTPMTVTDMLSSNVLLLDDATMPSSAPTSAPAASAPAAPITPLNGALNNIPGYADTGISTTGFVEGSWTYSAHPPAGNILSDRVFDTKTESLQFDAVDLQSTRAVDYTKKTLDLGFGVEVLYGWDGAYLHSNGLSIYSAGKTASAAIPGAGGTAAIHPKAQADLVQANFTIMLPVGMGLGIEGGKFDTLVGYEVIDGPSNPLYSHSYIFAEEPLTHTGLLAKYNLIDPSDTTQSSQIIGGFSRGWDQATKDDNGSLDYMAQINYTLTGKYSFLLTGITGDESPSGPFDGWRTLIDFNGTYTVSDQITLGYNGMAIWQAQAKNGGFGGGTSQTYAFAAYAKWQPNEYFAFNARGEWLDDMNGAAPTQLASGITNIPNQFYEVTIGVTYKPLPDDKYLSGFAIRPEGRWDYSDHAGFNGGSEHDQWTGAVEAYFSF